MRLISSASEALDIIITPLAITDWALSTYKGKKNIDAKGNKMMNHFAIYKYKDSATTFKSGDLCCVL